MGWDWGIGALACPSPHGPLRTFIAARLHNKRRWAVGVVPQGARAEERAPSRRMVESGKPALGARCGAFSTAARIVGAVGIL